MRSLPLLFTGFSWLLASQAFAYGNIEVLVETTGCNGETGFSSFQSSKLHKISEAWCNDPNDSSKKLQQVMIRSQGTQGGFRILWVTQAEARNAMQQIKQERSARIDRIQGPNVRIDMHNHDKGHGGRPRHQPPGQHPHRQQPSQQQSHSSQTDQVAQSNQPAQVFKGPTISILDPEISNTRSITHIMTGANLKERVIVGKVDAPAGLISLTVNGAAAKFDQNGVFKATVTLNKSQTKVDVVAIDKQGKKQNVEFQLHREVTQNTAKSPKQDTSTEAKNGGEFGNYYALIIANNTYQHLESLKTPSNDSSELSRLLKNKFGFEVINLDNANRYQMMTALNDIRGKLTEKDNLLIYYAGHGAFDSINNRGHWLPTDAELNSTANWISTIAITDIVNSMSAKHVLLVADSCYSGALTRSSVINLDAGMSDEARNKWLHTMAKTRSRHLLASGGIKPVLDDGGNGHSVFASAFIDVLKQSSGIIESSSIFSQVKRKVEIRAQQLNVEQTPMYAKLQKSEHEFGEFLLVPVNN